MSPINSSSTKSSCGHSTRSRLARMLNRWTIFSVTSIAMIVGSTWYAYEQSKLVDQQSSAATSQEFIDVDYDGVHPTERIDVSKFEALFTPGTAIGFEFTGDPSLIKTLEIDDSTAKNEKTKKFESAYGDYVIEAPDVLSIEVGKTISGKYAIGPDGKVNLDKYGSVYVSGKTIEQAKTAIAEHLAKSLENPKVVIDVYAMNSKKYYVITEGYGTGDNVQSFHITGDDTVLDAIVQVQGLKDLSSKNIRIARPMPGQKDQILTVDWNAITKNGDTATNYQLMPNDRLYIESDRLVAAKKIEPLFRAIDAISHSMSVCLFPMAHNGSETFEIPEKEIVSQRYTIGTEANGKLAVKSHVSYSDKSVGVGVAEVDFYTAYYYSNNHSTVYTLKSDLDSTYNSNYNMINYVKSDLDIASKKTKKLPERNVSIIETTYKDGTVFYTIERDKNEVAKSNANNLSITKVKWFSNPQIKVEEFGIEVEELKLDNGEFIYEIYKNDQLITADSELLSEELIESKPLPNPNQQELTVRQTFAGGIIIDRTNIVSEGRSDEPNESTFEQPSLFTMLLDLSEQIADSSEPNIATAEFDLPMPEISAEELAQIKLASYTEASDEANNKESVADAPVSNSAAAFAGDTATVSDAPSLNNTVHYQTRAAQPVRETDIPREMDQSKIISNPFVTAANIAASTAIRNTNSSEQKQVTVKFEVMELSRTKLRSLGVDWSISGKSVKQDGIAAFISSPNEKLVQGHKSGPAKDNLSMGFIEEKKAFDQFLAAMKRNHLVKVLAEPTMSIVAGRTARFHTGSEFPVTKDNGAGTVAIEYKKVGTEIACKPILLKNETLRLEIHPRLSEIDSSRSVTMNGVTIPGLRVREIDTGFEVQVGQTVAICGMPQTKISAYQAADGKIVEEVNEIDTLILVTVESIQGLSPTEMPTVATAGCYDQAVCASDENALPRFAQAAPSAPGLSLPASVSREDADLLNSIKRSMQIDVLKGNPLLSEGASRDASQNPPMPLVDAPHNPDMIASDDDCPGSTPRTTRPRRLAQAGDPTCGDEDVHLSSMNEQKPVTFPAPTAQHSPDVQLFPVESTPSAQLNVSDAKRKKLIATAKQLEALAYELDEDSLYDQADSLRATASEYRMEVRALKGDVKFENPLKEEQKAKKGENSTTSLVPSEKSGAGNDQLAHPLRIHDTLRIEIKEQKDSSINSQLEAFSGEHFSKMTVTIVDIRPNGNLVFEGIKKIVVDDELYTMSVTGTVAPKDVSKTNTVTSDQIAELVIDRHTEGLVRKASSSFIGEAKKFVQQAIETAVNPF